MALFGSKKEKKAEGTATKSSAALAPVIRDISRVIVKPVITEKAAVMGESNIYTFEVARTATKFDVRNAVRKLWGVVPAKINIVNRVPRAFVVKSKNRKGTHPGVRKAYVYLKKGDTIELV